MKPPSKSWSGSTRAQGTPQTSGPGPTERGKVKQGTSAGVFPGNREAGNQGPGVRRDNTATIFADQAAGLVGSGSKVGGTRHRGK